MRRLDNSQQLPFPFVVGYIANGHAEERDIEARYHELALAFPVSCGSARPGGPRVPDMLHVQCTVHYHTVHVQLRLVCPGAGTVVLWNCQIQT